ncbi:MAG TPA: bifunctional 2-keto-4-hydroxyglutarate aldolase/2-keto-3-deoxy-6-phosphogluconate aldolase [Clostridiaceae bacterium]|nr:bifunctional 2-keto-4-hydroxyglutarate aldolase/2-keto-3-deoxy-6-phosphogluconate aldolase [Clostridiaceae bacterium]
MTGKEKIVSRIKESGLVAVIRADNSEQAAKITDACIEGGVAAIEITFTVPGAHKVIEDLARKYTSGEIIIGAGTVLDPETARIAILSGAQYVVSPCLNIDTVKLCNRYQVACMPGAMTIKEVVECMEAGADIVKIFPGELFGPKIIKSIKGPIPQAQLMPTGGVNVDNVAEWIKAGAVAVGAGSSLTAGAKKGDYASITTLAKQFIEKIKEARM